VLSSDTRLGYWDWVASQKEHAAVEKFDAIRQSAIEEYRSDDGINVNPDAAIEEVEDGYWISANIWIDKPEVVTCSICGNDADAETAHLHQGKHIGSCCWDDRLKTTE